MLYLLKCFHSLGVQRVLFLFLLHPAAFLVIAHAAAGRNIYDLQTAPAFQLFGKALIHTDAYGNHNNNGSCADYHAQHRQDCPQLALEQVAHSHAD